MAPELFALRGGFIEVVVIDVIDLCDEAAEVPDRRFPNCVLFLVSLEVIPSDEASSRHSTTNDFLLEVVGSDYFLILAATC